MQSRRPPLAIYLLLGLQVQILPGWLEPQAIRITHVLPVPGFICMKAEAGQGTIGLEAASWGTTIST